MKLTNEGAYYDQHDCAEDRSHWPDLARPGRRLHHPFG